MSDALSDISRDQRRGNGYCKFFNLLADYLIKKDNDDGLLKKLIKVAKDTDDISGRGYFSGPSSLANGLEDKIKLLKNGDKNEWAKLLARVAPNDPDCFQRLKKISPFSEGLFIMVDYGCGFVNFGGELKEFLNALIDREGLKTYDADKYAVIIPKPESSEVIWLNCGRSEVDGPRKVK